MFSIKKVMFSIKKVMFSIKKVMFRTITFCNHSAFPSLKSLKLLKLLKHTIKKLCVFFV